MYVVKGREDESLLVDGDADKAFMEAYKTEGDNTLPTAVAKSYQKAHVVTEEKPSNPGALIAALQRNTAALNLLQTMRCPTTVFADPKGPFADPYSSTGAWAKSTLSAMDPYQYVPILAAILGAIPAKRLFDRMQTDPLSPSRGNWSDVAYNDK
jgi:hypothetical protein